MPSETQHMKRSILSKLDEMLPEIIDTAQIAVQCPTCKRQLWQDASSDQCVE